MARARMFIVQALAGCVLLGVPLVSSAATLAVSPASWSPTVGDSIAISIAVDTQGAGVHGVDIRSLRYNPAIFEVQDDDAVASGIQIAPGTAFGTTPINTVDPVNGVITISQITNRGMVFTGTAIIGTVHVKAKTAGAVSITFDFTPGSTIDSNVAQNGTDVLTSVMNGLYNVSGQQFSSPSFPSPSSSSSSSSSSVSSPVAPSVWGVTSYQAPSSVSVPTVSPASTPWFVLKRILYRGTRGDDVKNLQTFLIGKKHLAANNITGFFGPLTQQAVQKFQCAQGIVCSGDEVSTGYGVIGLKTRARVHELAAQSTEARQELLRQIMARLQELQLQLKLLKEKVSGTFAK